MIFLSGQNILHQQPGDCGTLSQEEIETHGNVKGEITYTLYGLKQEKEIGRFFPDGTLISNIEAICQHSGRGLRFLGELESERVRLVPREGARQYMELLGSPDWLMEIVSDSSVGKDTKLLKDVYQRAPYSGILARRCPREEIDFQILSNVLPNTSPRKEGRLATLSDLRRLVA